MTSADKAPAVDTVVLAFASDPVSRWSWPQAQQYLASMPRLVSAFAERAFDHGSAYCTDGDAGVAFWLPPGVHPDEERLAELIESTTSASIRHEVFSVFDRWRSTIPLTRTGSFR
jgi:hypothetical protein